MKICVLCPGSFTNGLDSAERGESRWSQNYAKMLAMAGHDVYAASMGRPEPRIHYGVKLINELEVKANGPYDLYMDSSWWKDKQVKSPAKKYVCLKWSLEDYTRSEPFPEDFYLAYPYPSHRHWFSKDNFVNKQKTFALPTMFGTSFPKPNWDSAKIFIPGKIDLNREYKSYMPAVLAFLNKYPIEGCSRSFFQSEFKDQINFDMPGSNWFDLSPFDKTMEAMKRCRLSVPIMNPGCIIEAAFNGVPSIFWEHGGFYNELGNLINLTVPHGAPPERFTEVAETLMTNKKIHAEATMFTQTFFSSHLYSEAMKYFNLMVETIF